MSGLREIIRDAVTFNTTLDYNCEENAHCVIRCVTAGNLVVEWPSGLVSTYAMQAGDIQRIWPKKIKATTSGTYEKCILW